MIDGRLVGGPTQAATCLDWRKRKLRSPYGPPMQIGQTRTTREATGARVIHRSQMRSRGWPSLDRAGVREHVVKFLEGGAHAGGQCIVVAIPEHAHLLRACLAPTTSVTWYDAAGLLSAFVVNGNIDPAAFHRAVGHLLQGATPGRTAYVYQEMVALLCMQRKPALALRVEKLWRAAAAALPEEVMEEYPRRVFASMGDAESFAHEEAKTR